VRKRNSSVDSLAPKTFLAQIVTTYFEPGVRPCSIYSWVWMDWWFTDDTGMLYSTHGVSCVSLSCGRKHAWKTWMKIIYTRWNKKEPNISQGSAAGYIRCGGTFSGN